jgi:hypothetical protein
MFAKKIMQKRINEKYGKNENKKAKCWKFILRKETSLYHVF